MYSTINDAQGIRTYVCMSTLLEMQYKYIYIYTYKLSIQ
jgi:hypothetical protein